MVVYFENARLDRLCRSYRPEGEVTGSMVNQNPQGTAAIADISLLSDDEIVQKASDGSLDAFTALVRRYESYVYRTAYHITENSEDAYDLAQEIFLKMWNGITQFRGDARFLTWLTSVSKNAAADWVRKNSRRVKTLSIDAFESNGDEDPMQREPMDPAPQTDPQQMLLQTETAEILRDAMQRLSEEHCVVLRLRDMEGMSYEMISQSLGLEVGTVKSRLFRARSQLKKILEELHFFE